MHISRPMYMPILFTNNNVREIRHIKIRIIVTLTIFNNIMGLREMDENNIAFSSRQDSSLDKIWPCSRLSVYQRSSYDAGRQGFANYSITSLVGHG